jgi:hypothetical protein
MEMSTRSLEVKPIAMERPKLSIVTMLQLLEGMLEALGDIVVWQKTTEYEKNGQYCMEHYIEMKWQGTI